MFIKKTVANGRVYYSVVESYRCEGERNPKMGPIVSLGYEKSLSKAYQKELRAYLKAADKLQRMEKALAVMGPEAEYHAGR